MSTLAERVKQNEGFRNKIYKDTLGFATIGYGHKVVEGDPFEEGVEYPEEELYELFLKDLQVSIKDAERFCEGMDIDDNVKECVTHMSFQLGLPKLNQFKKFKKALQDNDIETAIAEMKDSRAYNQTTNRWDRLFEKMRKSI